MATDARPEFRVLQFLPPMPLGLYASLCTAIGDACKEEGYDAFFTEADGLGVVHVAKIQEPVDGEA